MTTVFDADVDSLIGSLQSVYAGDRGHAVSNLRNALFASLSHVALGPKAGQPDAPVSPPTSVCIGLPMSPALGTPPALPARPPSPDIFAPGSPFPDSAQGRSRAGSRVQRNPPPSPANGRVPRHARLYAQPYATRRPRAHKSRGCNANSAECCRQATPEGGVEPAASVSEFKHLSQPRVKPRCCGRSRSSSTPLSPVAAPQGVSTSLLSSEMHRGLSCGTGQLLSSSLPKSPVPAWGRGIDRMHTHGPRTLFPFHGLPSPSVASSEGLPDSIATSGHTSVLDLLPEAGLTSSLPSTCPR